MEIRQDSITRRHFIQRAGTATVATAFALSAFKSLALTNASGSCFCWTKTLARGESLVMYYSGPNAGTVKTPTPGNPGGATAPSENTGWAKRGCNPGEGAGGTNSGVRFTGESESTVPNAGGTITCYGPGVISSC